MLKKILLLSFIVSSLAFSQPVKNLKVKSIDGSSIKIKDKYEQGAVMINFWALWCEPCRAEMRHLNELYNKYKEKGFTLIGINQDSPKSVAKVKSYISSQKIDFPVAIDPNFEIFNRMNGQVLPYSLLIDRNGKIVYRQTGYVPGDEKKMDAAISKSLDAGE